MVDADLSVREIIGSMFDVSPESITRETVAADVDGWDSLGHVTLMMMIERRLNVVLGEDDAGDLSDVGALIDKVSEQLNRS
ncbi:acyl carrier protein [compost metagenome]